MERCIFWNLYDNIGDLAPIYMELQGQIPSRSSKGLRNDIKEVLEQFKREGFHNIAMDSRQQSQIIIDLLGRTGLASQFDLVYGEEYTDGDEDVYGVFDYSELARSMKISLDELVEGSIIFGTSPDDEPKNSRGMVYVQHHMACNYDAWIAKYIMDSLHHAEGIQRGFDVLFDKGIMITARSELYAGHRLVSFTPGVSGHLSYVDNICRKDDALIPMIDSIRAEAYLRELQKIR